MDGHSDHDASLNQVLWPDAALEQVMADYDAVVLRVRESTGRARTIRCEGYIGYSLCGLWDEILVERAEVTPQLPFLDECVSSISRRLGKGWVDSGNPQRNTRRWKALVIHLSDGSRLEIVAASFTTD